MSALTKFFDGMHGVIFPFAGTTAPTGFLLCYGQAVSRITYAALFGAIGTTYGAGDGTTTFNLSDLRGRVIAGKDNMGGVAASRLTNTGTGSSDVDGATLGAAGGADRHTLTSAQMPAHNHAIDWSEQNVYTVGTNRSGPHGAASGSNTNNSGGDEAHPNVQPTIVLNYIIKT